MILFVDIDGVLHPDPPQPDQRLRSLPRLVEVLRDHPQVEVVISSLWREHLSLEQLRDLFPVDLRERIIDVTPIAERIDGWLPARREGEILEWLEASGRAGESWLAIDDQKWQFTQRRDLLIACDFYDGITDAIEAELRERLAEFAVIERFLAWASAQYEIEQAIVQSCRASGRSGKPKCRRASEIASSIVISPSIQRACSSRENDDGLYPSTSPIVPRA